MHNIPNENMTYPIGCTFSTRGNRYPRKCDAHAGGVWGRGVDPKVVEYVTYPSMTCPDYGRISLSYISNVNFQWFLYN